MKTSIHSREITGTSSTQSGEAENGNHWVGASVALKSPIEVEGFIIRETWASTFAPTLEEAKASWNRWIEGVKAGSPSNVEVRVSEVEDEETGDVETSLDTRIRISAIQAGEFHTA